MSDDYACGGSRNKKRNKAKLKREKSPYKAGGRFRSSTTINETDNSSKKVTNLKKKKGKKPKVKKR